MAKTISLIPAYGRDYKSKKAIMDDLAAGKDFVISDIMNRWDGKPASACDLVREGYTKAMVRYGKMRKVTVVPLKCVK
jgi:hypothetical protein